MTAFKKIKWIPILMIFSQLMLTGFVVYWLTGQYREEKLLLSNDVSRSYEESHNQLIDSMLLEWVVEPALKDSVNITIMTSSAGDTAVRVRHQPVHSEAVFQSTDQGKTMFAIALNDSMSDKIAMPARSLDIAGKKQDLLIRSVKLFINHSEDSTLSQSPMSGLIIQKADTALFKKVFAEKIREKRPGLSFIWLDDTLQTRENVLCRDTLMVGQNVNAHFKPGLQFTSPYPDDLPLVKVTSEFQYLTGQIIPQILFALILLLLTGSAFYYTNRSLKRQLMLNSLRNDFVSNITHELKTPVSTVKVALEALKTFDKVSNPAVTREYLDMAGQEMNRLDLLISQILDQSLIGEQNDVIRLHSTDLKSLTETVVENLQPRLASRNAKLTISCPATLEPVMADSLHFQGVLSNLIDNSLKYGPEFPEISIRLIQESRSTILEISDNGPGIPKEYLSRVFDKFFRVPKGDTHNIKGYGLGLSFAALVMKQHGGTISVRNLENGGCAFTLNFPRKTT